MVLTGGFVIVDEFVNRVAAEFYDSSRWDKYRFWKRFTPFNDRAVTHWSEEVFAHLPKLATAGQRIIPRVNGLDTGLTNDDLAAVVGPHVYGVSIGKVRTPEDVGTISAIIDELEKDKRGLVVTLPQSKDSFKIPGNVFLLGTMNTADRSIKLPNAALRRRFAFMEMMPDVELLRGRRGASIRSPLYLSFCLASRHRCARR